VGNATEHDKAETESQLSTKYPVTCHNQSWLEKIFLLLVVFCHARLGHRCENFRL